MTVQDAGTEESKGSEETNGDASGAGPDKQADTNTGQKTFDAEYVAKLRQEAAKFRTEARAAAEKAKKFDEAEAAGKSELEKANEAAAESAKQLAAIQVELLRSQVAVTKKLPAALAERLRGSSKEEMEADADALMAELGKQFVSKTGTTSGDTGAGVKGTATNYEAMSPKDLVKAVRERNL